MGFYPALCKKSPTSNKLQITESEKCPGCAYVLGNFLFNKSQFKLGWFSVSDPEKKSQKNLLQIYKTISYKQAAKLLLDSKYFSVTHQHNPTFQLVNSTAQSFTAESSLPDSTDIHRQRVSTHVMVHITSKACAY